MGTATGRSQKSLDSKRLRHRGQSYKHVGIEASDEYTENALPSNTGRGELNEHSALSSVVESSTMHLGEILEAPVSRDVRRIDRSQCLHTQNSPPLFTSSLPVLQEVSNISSWLDVAPLDSWGQTLPQSQPELQGRRSRRSSTATTASCEVTPPARHTRVYRTFGRRYNTMLERELELERIDSDGNDYISRFDDLVKGSVPTLGRVQRNLIQKNSMPDATGDKVSDISDEEPQPRPKANRHWKSSSKRVSRRQMRPVEKEAAPATLRRHNTMPSLHRGVNEDVGSIPLKRQKTAPNLELNAGSRHKEANHSLNQNKGRGKCLAPTKPSLNMKPLRQQFLKDQVFFWLPNDEKLQGRKLRMLRAQEWGAERAVEFTARVTHLIIEENWDYQYALRQLGLSSLPEHIIVVNEKYPPGCLELGYLADPLARRFRVKGHQEAIDQRKKELRAAQDSVVESIEECFTKSAPSLAVVPGTILEETSQTQEHRELAARDENDDSYEVPDSQPENIPGSPTSPAPRRVLVKNRALAESFEIKPGSRNPQSSPVYPDEPNRAGSFRPVRQAPTKPFVPNWHTPPRKSRKTPPLAMEATPQFTPSVAHSSFAARTPQTPGARDLLDVAIDEMKKSPAADLSGLSSEESDVVTDNDAEVPHSENGSHGEAVDAEHPFQKTRSKTWQDAFLCMHKNDGSTANSSPNGHTIALLQEMLSHYENVNDEWRIIGYRKAITALRAQKIPITTKAQALRIRGIGSRLADKIEEIASTSRLRRLEHARDEPNHAAIQLFLKIYGVGLRQARRWVDRGFATLDDLKQHAILTESQRIGVDHYEDLQQRIPRKEAASHLQLMNKTLVEISWKLRVELGGSYRRGSSSCGDVDFIITTSDESLPDHVLSSMVFDQLIPRLYEIGYLKATLASHSSNKGTKWHGAAVLPTVTTTASAKQPSVWRRVDILLVPARELGAAMIYFTGNDIFNRSMRLLARRKGMRLNQRGLYRDVLRGGKGERLTQGTLVEGKDEKRIFEALGVPYREPSERVC